MKPFLLAFLAVAACGETKEDTQTETTDTVTDTSTSSGTNTSTDSETSTDSDTSTDTTDSSSTDTEESTPTIWSGPRITFIKEDHADHTDPANQDAITDLVILTRGAQNSLFNVVVESAGGSATPTGTEWAKGNTDELENLEFKPLKAAANNQLKNTPGESYVLHLIEEDIYMDVTFLSWTSGGSGGGFSYERSTSN